MFKINDIMRFLTNQQGRCARLKFEKEEKKNCDFFVTFLNSQNMFLLVNDCLSITKFLSYISVINPCFLNNCEVYNK